MDALGDIQIISDLFPSTKEAWLYSEKNILFHAFIPVYNSILQI